MTGARSGAVALLVLIAAMLLAPTAQAACPQTSLIEIQDEVMCVICGVPLVNAGGPQSDDQRDFIRERADQCESKEQIKNALVAEYGPAVLAVPQKSGFDLTAYLIPIFALLGALVAIFFGARKWSKVREPLAAGDGAQPGEELNEDIKRYDF